MQSVNCVSLLLGAAILSASLQLFVTVAHRELLMVTNSDKGPITKQEFTIDKTSIGEGIGNNSATRRKLVSRDAVMEKAEGKDARSIPSSGAKHPVGKCGPPGRKDLTVNCYFSSRKLPPKVYFDGHIPFTADYPKPEHHHPKNN